MSLSEAQQLFEILTEIEQILQNVQTAVGEIDREGAKLGRAVGETLILRRSLNGILSMVRRLSGSESLDNFANVCQRAVRIVSDLRIAATLLTLSNPWLMALGIFGFIAISAGELMALETRGE